MNTGPKAGFGYPCCLRLAFTKMHGLGNDFIVFDASRPEDVPSPAALRHLADRRTGIGFDQALVLAPPVRPGTDVHYRIFNADASEGNQILARFADKLPIRWEKGSITVAGKSYPADRHALIAVYPNPLNPKRYVVLNSGFTFREYAHLNNARQVPVLPDWAVVDLATSPGTVWPGTIVAAGFFDEQWQVKP